MKDDSDFKTFDAALTASGIIPMNERDKDAYRDPENPDFFTVPNYGHRAHERTRIADIYSALDFSDISNRIRACEQYEWVVERGFPKSLVLNQNGRPIYTVSRCLERICPACWPLWRQAMERSLSEVAPIRQMGTPLLLTLTLPRGRRVPLEEQAEAFMRHFSALVVDREFREMVPMGIASLETTTGRNRDGFHVHAHLAVPQAQISQEWLSDIWTQTCRGYRVPLAVLEQNRLITSVSGRKYGGRSSAVNYGLKGNDTAQFDVSQLAEVVRWEQSRALIFTFGVSGHNDVQAVQAPWHPSMLRRSVVAAHRNAHEQQAQEKTEYIGKSERTLELIRSSDTTTTADAASMFKGFPLIRKLMLQRRTSKARRARFRSWPAPKK